MRQLVRYKNRHIYDYQMCCYVKLPDILELVYSGVEFSVIEDETKKDITREVLLGVIHQSILSKYVFPKKLLFKVLRETPTGESPLMRLFNFDNLTETEIKEIQIRNELSVPLKPEKEKDEEIQINKTPILYNSSTLPIGLQTY